MGTCGRCPGRGCGSSGQKIPEVPYIVREWLKTHSGQQPPDGLILTQPWSRGPAGAAVTETIYYQYRASRARRALRGISEQVSKAERVVAGKIPVKRNRFITLTGAQKSVNRYLEAKPKRWLAGRDTSRTWLPRGRST